MEYTLLLSVLLALVAVGAVQEDSDTGTVTDLSICPGSRHDFLKILKCWCK